MVSPCRVALFVVKDVVDFALSRSETVCPAPLHIGGVLILFGNPVVRISVYSQVFPLIVRYPWRE